MRGLRKPEGNDFERFFSVVQNAAGKTGAVFFLFAGEGNEQENGGMEMMDMSGWLIPESDANEFEVAWKQSKRQSDLDKWSDFFTFAKWSNSDGAISVSFSSFQ